MKPGAILVFMFVLISSACNKDKITTKPQLELKSKNTDVVQINQDLRVVLKFTDKEGDADDSLFVVRQRLNKKGALTMPPSNYTIPKYPTFTNGEFEVTLTYQFGLIFGLSPIRIPGTNPSQNEPDTLNLKFVVRDMAGNKSDTLTLSNIIVIR